ALRLARARRQLRVEAPRLGPAARGGLRAVPGTRTGAGSTAGLVAARLAPGARRRRRTPPRGGRDARRRARGRHGLLGHGTVRALGARGPAGRGGHEWHPAACASARIGARTRVASAALTEPDRTAPPALVRDGNPAPMPHPLSHGIDTYFGEFFANRRRVATVLLVVSGMLAVVVGVAGRRASEVFEDPKRFGYEGPKQWVDRIRLEQMADHEAPGLFQVTYLTAESKKGGRKPTRVSSNPQSVPVIEKVAGTG